MRRIHGLNSDFIPSENFDSPAAGGKHNLDLVRMRASSKMRIFFKRRLSFVYQTPHKN